MKSILESSGGNEVNELNPGSDANLNLNSSGIGRNVLTSVEQGLGQKIRHISLAQRIVDEFSASEM